MLARIAITPHSLGDFDSSAGQRPCDSIVVLYEFETLSRGGEDSFGIFQALTSKSEIHCRQQLTPSHPHLTPMYAVWVAVRFTLGHPIKLPNPAQDPRCSLQRHHFNSLGPLPVTQLPFCKFPAASSQPGT